MSRPPVPSSYPALLLFLLLFFGGLQAQEPASTHEGYRLPPDPIVDILDAPGAPSVAVSPDRSRLLMVHTRNMPSLADMAEPMLALAGRRINPRTHTSFGPAMVSRVTVMEVASRREVQVDLPGEEGWGFPSFSPDGALLFLPRTTDSGLEGWVADPVSGEARRLVPPRINNTGAGSGCNWLPDSRHLLCSMVPEGTGPPPEAPRVPTSPSIQETTGATGIIRTFQDLLSSPHDEALYDHFVTSVPVVVSTADGATRTLAGPANYAQLSPSPSGEYFLVSRRVRPYSYLLPDNSFPRENEILDTSGQVVRRLPSDPLLDNIPAGGVQDGPRGWRWMNGEPHSLTWVEALDGGNPTTQVAHRDRMMRLEAPFQGEGEEWVRTEFRHSGIWNAGGGTAFLVEFDRPSRTQRTWLVQTRVAGGNPSLLWERNSEDRYGDPGTPVMVPDASGDPVMLRDGDWIYLTGMGASPEGDRPFLDRMNLVSREMERLFRSGGGSFEVVTAILDARARQAVVRHETPESPPNFHLVELPAGTRTALTDFPDPHPQLAGVRKEFLTYEREDGVQLSATLYLPPDYREGERRPALVWAYPREFSNPEVAGQVSGSPYRFTRVGGSSHLFFLTQGYVVLDDAAMPIVGGDLANDTYVEQLVASGRAAVELLVGRGVADRHRIGVGGHSYGGFMTANLLAHSDLFRAGLARSGAYNRTLTPFGFQNERRTYWEAPEVYNAMSPFMHAHRIKAPILLIHGEVDNNSGTFPIQSERLYHALMGLGGTARLVMLPHESHGYRARESVMHALWEMITWFDRHVRDAEAPGVTQDR